MGGSPSATGFVLAVASRDAARTHRLFAEGLGLAQDDQGRYALGGLAIRIDPVSAEQPAGPCELTVAAADPEALRRRLAEAGFPAGEGGVVDLAGVAVRVVADEPATAADPWDPSGNVLGPDHIGVASDDSAVLSAALVDLLGFERESRQIDTQLEQPLEVFSSDRYGVVSHAGTPRPAGALLVSFLRREVPNGPVDVEILEDIMTEQEVPVAGPGSTTGDNRAISRFVRRRGPGLHHLAVRVRDIDAGLDRLRTAGIPLIDERGRPGSRRARIAFADRRGTGGVVVHLVERP